MIKREKKGIRFSDSLLPTFLQLQVYIYIFFISKHSELGALHTKRFSPNASKKKHEVLFSMSFGI